MLLISLAQGRRVRFKGLGRRVKHGAHVQGCRSMRVMWLVGGQSSEQRLESLVGINGLSAPMRALRNFRGINGGERLSEAALLY